MPTKGTALNESNKEGKSRKTLRKKQVMALVNSANIEGLINHFESIQGDNQYIWSLEGLRDASLGHIMKFGDILLANSKDPEKDSMLWYHLPNELQLRSMLHNYRKYNRIKERFPVLSYTKSWKAQNEKYGATTPSFKDNPDGAMDYFLTLFENYNKVVQMMANMAAVLCEERPIPQRQSIFYLNNVEGGRYSALAPTSMDRSIRNAIAHKDIFLDGEGRIDFPVNKKRCQRTPEFLDERTKVMAARTVVVLSSLALSLVTEYQVIITALKNR